MSEAYLLEIEKTDFSPRVIISEKTAILSGESRPEDVIRFYEPVIEKINILSDIKPNDFEFVFDFNYLNSSSLLFVTRIIFKLANSQKTWNMKVVWKYFYLDEDIKMLGEDLAEITSIEMSLIEKKRQHI